MSAVARSIVAGLIGIFAVGAPSPARSAVTPSGEVTILGSAPDGVTKAANLDGPDAQVFLEGSYRFNQSQAVDVLGANLAPVGPISPMGNYFINSLDDILRWRGDISAQIPFRSYFVHMDSQNDEDATEFIGSVTFDRNILGVILLDGQTVGSTAFNLLGDTDSTLGNPFTDYPGRTVNAHDIDLRDENGNFSGDGSVLDTLRISQDLRTLSFEANNRARMDQFRILVANGNVFVNQSLPTEIVYLPSITVPGPTLEIDVDPFDFNAPITQQLLNEGFDDCMQGARCQIFEETLVQYKETELISATKRIDTNGAVQGVDFGADNINDPFSYYALTHADVFVDWIDVQTKRDVFEEVNFKYFLELPIGDYHKDGIVDEADLAVWQATYGNKGLTPFIGAVGNGDGTIDGQDLLVWQRQFGQSAGALASASTSVPEPAAWSLVGIALVVANCNRSSRLHVTESQHPFA